MHIDKAFMPTHIQGYCPFCVHAFRCPHTGLNPLTLLGDGLVRRDECDCTFCMGEGTFTWVTWNDMLLLWTQGTHGSAVCCARCKDGADKETSLRKAPSEAEVWSRGAALDTEHQQPGLPQAQHAPDGSASPTMTKTWIWVDFNQQNEDGSIRLGTVGTVRDIRKQGIKLKHGMTAMLSDDEVIRAARIELRGHRWVGVLLDT